MHDEIVDAVGSVLATLDIRSRKRPTKNDYPSVLARKHETCLQSESIALFSNAVHLWYWQRRSFFCVLRFSPHETSRLQLLLSTATTTAELDKTTPSLTAARDDHGSFPRESRTTCRECPLASTTHCAAPTNQTANMYHNGSASLGASGKSSSDIEASFVHCSTRDPAPLASPSISCILEAQVQSNVSKTKNLSRGHRIDQRDGAEQSALGSRANSWRVAQARYSRV